MRVGVEHDDRERQDVRRVRVLEHVGVTCAVPRGEGFHQPIDLLRLARETKRRHETPQRDVKVILREIVRLHERAHHRHLVVVEPAE